MNLEIIEKPKEENIRLKKKINKLIDLVTQLQHPIEPARDKNSDSCNAVDLTKILQIAFQKIEEQNLIIPYKKNSKNSKEFYRISEREFSRILKEVEGMEDEKNQQKIYDFLSGCELIKVQVNGKICWNELKENETLKVILVKKRAYQYFLNLPDRSESE